MNQKITLREWLVNFFRGIWQALCWIGRAFNPKNKTIFWRVIWAVITCCILFFTCIVGWAWYQEEYKRPMRYTEKQRVSSKIDFVKPVDSRWSGWMQNVQTGEVITKDVDWVAISADEDSLIVYGSKGKRGYINRFTGEVSIPAKYKKAWIFSSGVAGVIETDSVFFIDHSSEPINNKKYKFNAKPDGYVYHGDYCAIAIDSGRMGLIDKSGNWAVKPEFDKVIAESCNFWKLSKGKDDDNLWYAFNDKAEQITDKGYPAIEITPDYGVIASLPNHLLVAFGFDGQKSSPFMLNDYEAIFYDTATNDENGERIYEVATLRKYRMPDYYEGLCTASGEMVTEPLYWEISALEKDLYLCKFKGSNTGVVINSKGQILSQKEVEQ